MSYRGGVPSPVRRARALARVLAAVLSGLLTAQAFPTSDHWWLTPVGVALLSAAVLGARWRLAALVAIRRLAFPTAVTELA